MNVKTGALLPTVTIAEKGELQLLEHRVHYQPWESSQLKSKMRVIQHIAGKTGAKELNAPLIEAIKSANFPKNHYQTTTIINLDDVIWGTGAFVVSRAEQGKKEYPWSSVVLDSHGITRERWQLFPDSSAIFLLDQQGYVRFCKEGKLSKDEISDLISEIDLALGNPIYNPEKNKESLVEV